MHGRLCIVVYKKALELNTPCVKRELLSKSPKENTKTPAPVLITRSEAAACFILLFANPASFNTVYQTSGPYHNTEVPHSSSIHLLNSGFASSDSTCQPSCWPRRTCICGSWIGTCCSALCGTSKKCMPGSFELYWPCHCSSP